MPYKSSVKILLVKSALFVAGLAVVPGVATAQDQSKKTQDRSGMAGMEMDDGQKDAGSAEARAANDAMSGHDMSHDMNMGAHMFMTDLRPANAGDEKRADEILTKLRPAIEKYRDYKVALADGFQIFLPNVPQEHYHFTNYRYAFEAQFAFNPEHPTSLLYKKVGDGYQLEGTMYTAPKRATEDELNDRVPLSVATWHKHVNLCTPPKGTELQHVNLKQFGFRGTISTEAACEQVGGVWRPQVFGWMVHVYPFESDPAKIWAH
jgi:hypothetical protein